MDELHKKEVEAIRNYIHKMADFTTYATYMLEIYNKNLKKHLEKKLKQDITTEASRKEAASRLATINILPKMVNKLSRSANGCIVTHPDQELAKQFCNKFGVNSAMSMSARMLNLHDCVLQQVNGLGTNSPFVRVISADRFLVMSNDIFDPNKITHVILLFKDFYVVHTDSGLEYILNRNDDTFTVVPYPAGISQYNYLKRDTTELMPSPKYDDYEMVTLLPLLITDGNYALKYQAFSIIYTIDAKAKEMSMAPSAVWNFSGDGEDGSKPSVGTLTPKADIGSVTQMVEMEYGMWLQTKGIKSNGITLNRQDSTSGVAKIIDEGDVSEDVAYQREILAPAQVKLLEILGLEGAEVTYKQDVVKETPTETVDRIIKKLDAGLMTEERAIREANVHLSEQELTEMIEELNSEEEETDGVSSEGPENTLPSGQDPLGEPDREENSGQDSEGNRPNG
jgi:hypothetical protein